jgi:hypothetical protein
MFAAGRHVRNIRLLRYLLLDRIFMTAVSEPFGKAQGAWCFHEEG